MKAEKKKNKLRSRIIRYFVIFSFLILAVQEVIEGIYNELIIPPVEKQYLTDGNIVPMVFTTGSYVLLAILAFVGGVYVFYRFMLRAFNEENRERMREQNLIYAAIAHDLKTPMTSVKGFAGALSDGKVRPEEQQEIFDLISRKADSMNDMVDTLFEYTKLGAEDHKAEISDMDICTLVRDIVAENYAELEVHDIETDIDIPDEEIIIKADKKELKRAITNLIINVYKHNDNGIKTKISVKREAEKAVIRIADRGAVLPADVDIFEPFVTENTARTAGQGTGLGLAITKKIIARSGGEIFVNTAVRDYTKEFVVYLSAV